MDHKESPPQDTTATLSKNDRKESGRKRQLQELSDKKKQQQESSQQHDTDSVVDRSMTVSSAAVEESSLMDDTMASPPSPPLSQLQKLRLEAIFLPKFENETLQNQDIRTRMKERVAAGSPHDEKGYLEVTLKHSGSLVLWSGGQRFYSKNATENQFTHVGEILLRQHFFRAWHQDNNDNDSSKSWKAHYQDCSDFLSSRRLTLAFELVTSVLGHHGDVPNRDFLILTAVADRVAERFYDTSELVTLAHQFRLPHNDSWVFGTRSSVEALFALYDTRRETGMANDTIQALCASADSHVCSMYPHGVFQGNLLEGIVIRFVAYNNKSSSKNDDQLETMKQLAMQSKEILNLVPPETPASFDLLAAAKTTHDTDTVPPVLTTNVRDIFDQCLIPASKGKRLDSERFNNAIWNVLVESDGKDQRRTVQRWTAETTEDRVKGCHLVSQQLLDTRDEESTRIATMISTLDNLSGPKPVYKLLHEVEPQGHERWLCMIHIHADDTFRKFHKQRQDGDMALFRGCCLELVTDDSNDETEKNDSNKKDFTTETAKEDDTLMLKMKFLPYMIRTFVCRNGLSVIKSGGPNAFDAFAMNLMKKWNISIEGKKRWLPFVHAWGVYAHECLQGKLSKEEEENTSDLLQLTESYYLDHYERFRNLYENKKIHNASDGTESKSAFRGTVVVISLEIDTAERFASLLSVQLGGVSQRKDAEKLAEEDIILSIAPQGAGVIYSASVDMGVGYIRKHLKGKKNLKVFKNAIFVILVDCDQKSMDTMQLSKEERSELEGKTKSCRNHSCAVLEVSGVMSSIRNQEDFANHTDIVPVVEQLWSLSKAISIPDARPGMVVYFPVIPGIGKSTLCNSQTNKELQRFATHLASGKDGSSTGPKRKVEVLHGDKMKKKYWQDIKNIRDLNPSSVLVTDKNAPPTSWKSIGNTFSTALGVAVPVLPDGLALQTTTITGAKTKQGDFNSDAVNYYPFSLHYLAVCMSRVLDRPAGSHDGNLDMSTEKACMIVAAFFGLYRKTDADQFVDTLKTGTEKTGAMPSLAPIRIPFFAQESLPPLPPDLDAALTEALQLQVGWNKSSKEENEEINGMEDRLRKVLREHKDLLNGLTSDPEESRKTFVTQVKSRMQELDGMQELSLGSSRPFIKIVSVDVDAAQVHELLLRSCVTSSEPIRAPPFLLAACQGGNNGDATDETVSSKSGFIKNTHVTLAHHSEVPQSTMYELYDDVLGHHVHVKVNGLLWSERVAALTVTLDSVTNDQDTLKVPGSHHSFSHITVWHASGENAVLSHQLPKMVAEGNAEKLDFSESISLNGVISYWPSDKTSS